MKKLLSAALLLCASLQAHASDLIITTVFDGPLSGGVPKGVELLVLNDIADLSQYGLGSANNGGGTDGEEFTFPAAGATAGDYIYVASESTGFTSFFGFAPDYTSSAVNINGDDAIELFQSGAVVDVFGDINVDGTGQPWEHLDGWAARIAGSSPSGSTFQIAEWTFSGPNALDGETNNADAASPIPIAESGTPDPDPDPDPDPAPVSSLLLTAIFDGPLSGGVPKGVEVLVLSDIADLSQYGLGSANNGGGTDGQEFTFPAVAATAGDYIYVASESTGFSSFFGFAPDYTSFAVNINGDDAIELFLSGEVVDVFGDINVDGTGQPWEHLDGWAARVAGSSPSGSTFNIGEWTFSGPNALDGETTNLGAATPVPTGEQPAQLPNLLITAVFDGPLSGGVPKGIELYALDNIADLSAYGVGSANNGGGSDGIEFTFPAASLAAGDYIYLASESTGFTEFFGFAPDYTSSAVNINGDDAIELFFDGEVIDLFGDINVDGTGQAWEYQDGWASRTGGFSAPSPTFDLAEWSFSGPNALDGALSNTGAASPVLIGVAVPGGFSPPPLLLISEVQGATDTSPVLGTVVTVEAIVVGDFQDIDADTSRDLDGFYLQEETSDEDSDPMTSEGLFIFSNGFGVDVNVGDLVRVTGTVDEFFGETQLDTIQSIVIVQPGTAQGMVNQVTSALIDLGNNTEVTEVDDGEYVADLEQYEGMLVSVMDSLQIVEQFNLDRFNEIRLVAGDRPVQFTQTNTPDAAGLDAHLRAIAARSIVYDDGLSVQNASIDNLDGFAPYAELTAPRMGDRVEMLSGVLTFSFDAWRVRSNLDGLNQFTSTLSNDSPNPRPLTAPDVRGTLKIASFNVLNFFTTLDEPGASTSLGFNPRGADNQAEFDRQLAKLVNAIVELDADVLGLIELENEFDSSNDGSTAIETLVNAVNGALGRDIYDYIDPGQANVGSDAIAVGMIYKPRKTRLLRRAGPAVLDDSVAATLPIFAGHDFVNDPIFDGPSTNRASLAASFNYRGGIGSFTVVVNHFKSKGGSPSSDSDPNADQGDGAGAWNERRLNAAMAVDAWIDTNPTRIRTNKVVILGDLNAYAAEDPVQYLLGQGYQNVEDADAYSFVFDGQVGTLDYILISRAMARQFTEAKVWNINADEADALDYNLDFGKDPIYFNGTTSTRNSDHDPLVAGFKARRNNGDDDDDDDDEDDDDDDDDE